MPNKSIIRRGCWKTLLMLPVITKKCCRQHVANCCLRVRPPFHLTRLIRLWTFNLLGFEVFQVRLQEKATSTVSIEIHKGLKTNYLRYY
jgi:hypothetical protein